MERNVSTNTVITILFPDGTYGTPGMIFANSSTGDKSYTVNSLGQLTTDTPDLYNLTFGSSTVTFYIEVSIHNGSLPSNVDINVVNGSD